MATCPKSFPGSKKLHHATSRYILFLGSGFTLIAAILVVWSPQQFKLLDLVGYDLLLEGSNKTLPESDVVIVDIDEKSLRTLGQWPWPRYEIAHMIDRLSQAEPKSIGLDLLFSESDRLSIGNLKAELEKQFNVPIELGSEFDWAIENDVILAESIRNSGAVLGNWFNFEGPRDSGPLLIPSLNISIQRAPTVQEKLPIPVALRAKLPVPNLADAARTMGFLNSLPDYDGKVRRLPLLVFHEGSYYPSLALATVMQAMNETQLRVEVTDAGLSSVRFGDTKILVDRQGSIMLPFTKGYNKRFTRVSASDLLDGTAPASIFKEKIVLIGATAVGLRDVHAVPLERYVQGVFLQALAMDALWTGKVVYEPAWGLGARVLAVLLTGLLLTYWVGHYRILRLVTLSSALLVILLFVPGALFTYWGLFLSPLAPVGTLLLGLMLLGIARFFIEEKTARQNSAARAKAQDCAMLAMSSLAETRDPETGHHIMRTQHYVRALATHMATHPRFCDELTPENIETIFKSAPLHDIGKVGILDEILLKPGKLTPEQFEIMKTHTTIGYNTIQRAQEISGLKGADSFLNYASEIILSHHEKWNGMGYPNGLKGTEIPISARLMAMADVYDALRSVRVYKPSFSHAKARAIILEQDGSFDPDIVEGFLALEGEFIEIANKYCGDEVVPEAMVPKSGSKSRGTSQVAA